jgi:hypothetical protein
MSAVLTGRRPSRTGDRDRDAVRAAARQETLFAGSPAVAIGAAPTTGARLVETDAATPGVAARERQVRAPRADDVALPVAAARLGGPTLEAVVSAVWDDLLAGETAACPVCDSPMMLPRHSAGAGVVGGRCGACDATLS